MHQKYFVNIYSQNNRINKNMDKRDQVNTAYMDFQKAFYKNLFKRFSNGLSSHEKEGPHMNKIAD